MNALKEYTVHIDVVSDVMCPWCYVGKRRLEKALEMVRDIKVEVHWRPFQLDPTIPAEGRDRREYLEKKFGGKERAKEIYSTIEEAGRGEGLDFNFKAIKVSPNTIDAHRIIRWSMNEGAKGSRCPGGASVRIVFYQRQECGGSQCAD